MEKSSERALLQMSKKQELFEIRVEKTLENKIRRLCKELPNLEWSGALLYTHKGSIKDKNLEISAKDLYLMDVGSSTYTDFKKDPNIITYMIDKDLLECEVGLIHSHDQMSCFFSGTDLSTLQDEGTDMHHFVSLIVNNAGEYCAAVTCQIENAFDGKIKQSALTFNDEKQLLHEEPYKKSFNALLYWDMNVTVETVDDIIENKDDEELVARLEVVKREKAERLEKERKEYEAKWGKNPFEYDWDYYKGKGKDPELPLTFGTARPLGMIVDKFNAMNLAAKIATLNPCCTATSTIELKLQIKKNMTELDRLDSSIEHYGTIDEYFEAYIGYLMDRFQMYEIPAEIDSMTEKEYGEFLDSVEQKFNAVIKILDNLIKEFPNLSTMYTSFIQIIEMEKQCAMEL